MQYLRRRSWCVQILCGYENSDFEDFEENSCCTLVTLSFSLTFEGQRHVLGILTGIGVLWNTTVFFSLLVCFLSIGHCLWVIAGKCNDRRYSSYLIIPPSQRSSSTSTCFDPRCSANSNEFTRNGRRCSASSSRGRWQLNRGRCFSVFHVKNEPKLLQG